MSMQRIVGLIVAPLCLILIIVNPINRIVQGEEWFIWQDFIMVGFFGIFSASIFWESLLLKLLHIGSFFLGGTMVFLFPDRNILSFFLGFMIIYKTLELSFSYGFFKSFVFPKILTVAVIFWILIYIGIKNLIDSIMWSLLLDALAGISFAIHFELIQKSRRLDEQEKKVMEEKMLRELELERERAEQAEEDALTMYHKSQRLEKK